MQLSLPLSLEYVPVPRVVEIDALPPESPGVVEIDALLPDPRAERARIVGSWSGGRRYVQRKDRLAHIWFHFAPDGRSVLSIRYEGERTAWLTTGRWWLVDGGLTVFVGNNTIQGPYTFNKTVMYWAGEALVRVSPPLQVEQT